jgi:hypothetical protein
MQKKNKKSWSPLPNLFHRVTGNPKHTIIFLGLVCMYLLSHVCIKNIFDLPDERLGKGDQDFFCIGYIGHADVPRLCAC